ncbi:MAG: helix-turn-helix domain-containing protein [Treponema sp.]|jgi:AraC family transcriptional regulator|nr:helix-turn-helix domain-containing protein [Treponema sp.]
MINPYDLLEGVLTGIENGLKEDVNADLIAGKFDLSTRHLQRLFKFAFNQSLGSYIRSRKLAASIDDLLNTELNILDIALEYAFEYEPSYIRSFRREYGITPGDLRKTGKILSITPPLQLFNSQKYPNGVMFGPEIVVVPQFHVVGKKYKVPNRDTLHYTSLCSLGKNERHKIPNAINPKELICISYAAEDDADHFYSISAAQVKTLDDIPEGFESYTFPTSLCARFRFINNDTEDCNMYTSDKLYQAVSDFMDSEDQKYFLERKRISLDIINFSCSDNGGNYTQEWFSPVIKKTSLKIPSFSPSGIKKVYKQELPALRFIGKKCIETPQTVKVLNLLDNWQLNRQFDAIEKQSAIDYKTFFEGGDAYINLVRKKEGSLSEHWMGMFMPKGAEVPQGYHAFDFPKMTIAVCRVYGKRDEIADYEKECRNKLTEEGFATENAQWYFRRFNWHRFFEEDVYGKRLLDYCYPVM